MKASACKCKKCLGVFIIRGSDDNDKILKPKWCPYCGWGKFLTVGPVNGFADAIRKIAKREATLGS